MVSSFVQTRNVGPHRFQEFQSPRSIFYLQDVELLTRVNCGSKILSASILTKIVLFGVDSMFND